MRVFRVCFDPNGTADPAPTEPIASTEGGVHLVDASAPSVAADTDAVELAFWQSVQESNDPSEYQAYLAQFPEGDFAALAQARLTNPTTSEQPSSEDRTVELEFWNSIKDTEVRAMFEAYLEKYPDGEFRSLAEIRLEALAPGSAATELERK